jgi:hypothetical protein
MKAVRSVTALCALLLLAACATNAPPPLRVALCNTWVEQSGAEPAGSFDFTVSVDGTSASVDLAFGACADLGPYPGGAEVTIAQSVSDGLIVVAIERTARGSGAEQVLVQPATPSTTFRVDAYQ